MCEERSDTQPSGGEREGKGKESMGRWAKPSLPCGCGRLVLWGNGDVVPCRVLRAWQIEEEAETMKVSMFSVMTGAATMRA
jgi:hypothetical protein